MKETRESLSASPMWLITYRDCMTLMLVFFLLFMSFASFEDSDKLKKIKSALNEHFFPLSQPAGKSIQKVEAVTVPKNERLESFRDKKVFLADSAEIFWGDGAMISDNGKKFIAVIADFLKQMPNDIVICEKPAMLSDKNSPSGSERAWSIIEYLCRDKGMNYNRFKVSVAGTTASPLSYKRDGRMLEIVLLERSYAN
ncbi:MAG: hypothetical protein A2Y13_06470 [Planctomycetes bacterium GWC2_45_44]|nr:MAG: hypothetical protein A2Y13_06470 [Planctomycetes bacterium GWC2_45_44]HBR19526.1 hypothetical protein [Phycisphaerales bacterium]